MGFCDFSAGTAMYASTSVENLFMLEFMPNAPGDFVRVYLYVLMQCTHPATAGKREEVAKALNLESEVVENAFHYWEREGLIIRRSDNPPVYELRSCREAMELRPAVEDDYYTYRDFTNALQGLFGVETLLHPAQYTMAAEWVEDLHLPQDVVLYMTERELKHGRKRSVQTVFKKLDQTAQMLADQDVQTVEQAQAILDRDEAAENCAFEVLRNLNLHRRPTKPEIALAAKWVHTWHFTTEAIIESLQATTRSGNPSFQYIDTVLSSLRSDDGSVSGADDVRERFDAQTAEHERLKSLFDSMGIRRAPSEEDRRCLEAILSAGFDFGVVKAAAASGRKTSMEDLQQLLFKWAEQGIFTEEDLAAFRRKRSEMDQYVEKLFETAGIDRRPRQADRMEMENWLRDHSMGMILLAGERSRGSDSPMLYIKKLLAAWKKEGVTTPEAAEKSVPSKQGTAAQPNPAGNFIQRDYKEEDFEKDFYVSFDPDEEVPQ